MKGKITDANGEKDFDTAPETLTPSPSPLPGNTSSGFATFSPIRCGEGNPMGEGGVGLSPFEAEREKKRGRGGGRSAAFTPLHRPQTHAREEFESCWDAEVEATRRSRSGATGAGSGFAAVRC